MFSKCEPCRCFTQEIFQILTMDIKFRIKIFLTFCIFAGCVVADNVTTTGRRASINPFASSCVLSNRDVQKPLRARVFYRNPYNFKNMRGCINYDQYELSKSQESEAVKSKGSDPFHQRYLIHLAQKVKKASVMHVRLDIYATQNYTRPVDISLVLHSVSPFMWTLNMAHIAASISSHGTSNLRIFLTHDQSKLALEQLHLKGWRISVQHIAPKVISFNQLSTWVEENLFNHKPLTLSVHFPYTSSSADQSPPLEIVNAVDLTILPGNTASNRSRKICHDKIELPNWVTGFIDTSLDDGYTSCHTPNVWTANPVFNSSKDKVGKTVTQSMKKIKLLQTLEFGQDFSEPSSVGSLKFQLRVQMAPLSSKRRLDEKTTAILVLIGSTDRLQFLIDLRGLEGDLIVHTNINATEYILSPQARHTVVVEPNGLSADQYLSRVAARYDPDGFNSGTWHVERVRFSRLPHSPLPAPATTFIDVSLSMRPLMLRDLESLVHLQCFNTEDLAISLDAKTFENMGLQRKWVLLGEQHCLFSESEDGRWVRKFLLHSSSPQETCGTHKFSKGETVLLTNKIYITSPHKDGSGLAPYPLPVRCLYGTQSTADLPPIDDSAAATAIDAREALWRTWDGKSYQGSPSLMQSVRHQTNRLKLELFEDEKLSKKIVYYYLDVKTGQTLYARVQPEDQTVDYGLMVRDCFLSNTNKESHPLGYPRQYLLIKGCDMSDSFRWKEAYSFRVKVFSFVTPRLNFFAMGPYIYLHCNVQPCNYGRPKKGLPKCWNQYYLCNIPETPATTHLISVPLRDAEDPGNNAFGSSGSSKNRSGQRHWDGRPKQRTFWVPFWGAALIAGIAFLVGIAFATIISTIRKCSKRNYPTSQSHRDQNGHRRRQGYDANKGGLGARYGGHGKDVGDNKEKMDRIGHFRPQCLHRLLARNFLGDLTSVNNVNRDDATEDVVVELLATHRGVGVGGVDGGVGGRRHCPVEAVEDEDGLIGSTVNAMHDGSRVKNSHSTSCSVCGEGSSSGIGTGNCSSCSAQACSLVDEAEPHPPRHLSPPESGSSSSIVAAGVAAPAPNPAYLSYQPQQQPLPFSSHFASA